MIGRKTQCSCGHPVRVHPDDRSVRSRCTGVHLKIDFATRVRDAMPCTCRRTQRQLKDDLAASR